MDRPTTMVVTAALMRRIEASAVDAGTSYEALMELAGAEVARAIMKSYHSSRRNALILAGPGNNGGDALVVGRQLVDNGWGVRLRLVSRIGGKDDHLMSPLVARDCMPEQLDRA